MLNLEPAGSGRIRLEIDAEANLAASFEVCVPRVEVMSSRHHLEAAADVETADATVANVFAARKAVRPAIHELLDGSEQNWVVQQQLKQPRYWRLLGQRHFPREDAAKRRRLFVLELAFGQHPQDALEQSGVDELRQHHAMTFGEISAGRLPSGISLEHGALAA